MPHPRSKTNLFLVPVLFTKLSHLSKAFALKLCLLNLSQPHYKVWQQCDRSPPKQRNNYKLPHSGYNHSTRNYTIFIFLTLIFLFFNPFSPSSPYLSFHLSSLDILSPPTEPTTVCHRETDPHQIWTCKLSIASYLSTSPNLWLFIACFL